MRVYIVQNVHHLTGNIYKFRLIVELAVLRCVRVLRTHMFLMALKLMMRYRENGCFDIHFRAYFVHILIDYYSYHIFRKKEIRACSRPSGYKYLYRQLMLMKTENGNKVTTEKNRDEVSWCYCRSPRNPVRDCVRRILS